ncbi:hypothetical protein C1H46_002373 [Malus baccata]|uniref:Retrotransposon Copia-like N-terminal domain-containing protein n=1 Tax=Malus baccata TaxID=106549 RepID=A0A540NLR2_MALBA|nr:hypothetical protein C1H46_002373 [Malus baccata]
MVTSAQLALTQSPISSLILSLGNTVMVKLDDSNYVTWKFQLALLLDGNGILGFIDGSIPCPITSESEIGTVVNDTAMSDAFKIWKIHDKPLMTLITTTLSTTALSCVIGCTSSEQMWTNLCERFANMTRTNIVQLKIDLQNITKGPESIDDYLQRIKDARDKLAIIGVVISDEDIIIDALRELPHKYNTIKYVNRGRENLVFLSELRSQLKAEETTLDDVPKQVPLLSDMVAHTSNSVYDAGGISSTKSISIGSLFGGPSNSSVSYSPVLNTYQ